MTRARVTVVTSGHLATCPRMVKAADALHAAGHAVRVISTSSTPWAAKADEQLRRRRGWRSEVIAHDRSSAPVRWISTGARWRASQMIAGALGGARPRAVAAAAFSRTHAEIVRALRRESQDFIYGGTSGALAAIAEAGRRTGTPFAVDFEDFHCGEGSASEPGTRRNALAEQIMADAARGASFVTVASDAIGRACEERFGVATLTIHNVFPLPEPPRASAADGLRLYWFSQTIGPDRGLEDIVRAAGLAKLRADLHLRGLPVPGYLGTLEELAARTAPATRLVHHGPDDPDRLVDGCRAFDVGLALEPGHTINNALSLSNKALTYPLAGLAMVITNTPGQHPLAAHLADHAIVYSPGEVERLADGLARWDRDRTLLQRAKDAAWRVARERWHWEHPLERGQLLAAIRAA